MTDLTITKDALPQLTGKVALVTGGSSGIGLAAVKLFAEKGAQVLIGDLNPPAESVNNVSYYKVDVTDWKAQVDLFDHCIAQFGHLDIVFANAGIAGKDNTFADVLNEKNELQEANYSVLNINLLGLIKTVKLSIHHLRKRKSGGAIVVAASKASYSASGGPMYAMSKHGVLGMIRAMRNFLPPLNIRLNAIAPGFTETGMVGDIAPELKRLGVPVQQPEAVALAAVFLATNDEFHARCIQVNAGKYREIEKGYEAASELMFGDKDGGRSYMTPEAMNVIRGHFLTTV